VDLSELGAGDGDTRHPWETARADAVAELVARLNLRSPRTLDVGCGDAYLVDQLSTRGIVGPAVAQDIHLTDEMLAKWTRPGISLVRDLQDLGDAQFDLLLLLDVLEHIEEPSGFLRHLVSRTLVAGGHAIITVPAFQMLFTEHDRALAHYRRYDRHEIADVARSAELQIVEYGYLFSSLLLPRGVKALMERLRKPSTSASKRHGVGHWKAPAAITRLLHMTLRLDNRLALRAHDRGLTLPGLSAWLLCKKPS
jgi:hypothetical protein